MRVLLLVFILFGEQATPLNPGFHVKHADPHCAVTINGYDGVIKLSPWPAYPDACDNTYVVGDKP